jgi:hypothetical protein
VGNNKKAKKGADDLLCEWKDLPEKRQQQYRYGAHPWPGTGILKAAAEAFLLIQQVKGEGGSFARGWWTDLSGVKSIDDPWGFWYSDPAGDDSGSKATVATLRRAAAYVMLAPLTFNQQRIKEVRDWFLNSLPDVVPAVPDAIIQPDVKARNAHWEAINLRSMKQTEDLLRNNTELLKSEGERRTEAQSACWDVVNRLTTNPNMDLDYNSLVKQLTQLAYPLNSYSEFWFPIGTASWMLQQFKEENKERVKLVNQVQRICTAYMLRLPKQDSGAMCSASQQLNPLIKEMERIPPEPMQD